MTEFVIRNLDERVITRLQMKAEMAGRSVEEEVRDILTRAIAPSPQDRAALAAEIRASNKVPSDDSTELIRDMRDGRC